MKFGQRRLRNITVFAAGALFAFLYSDGFQVQAREPTSLSQEKIVPQGEIRVVDKSPLNWGWVVLNTFEHLMEVDKDGRLVPRLATTWRWLDDRTLEVDLRRGVRFHNGEVFNAEIVKLNWDKSLKLEQPHAIGTHFNFAPGSRLEIVDPYRVRFHFAEVDGGAYPKINTMHIANRQFYRELGWGEQHWCVLKAAGPYGTGPYKIVEGYSLPDERSDRVVLEANTDYWDPQRFPRLERIIFDNTLSQKEAVRLVTYGEGRVDLVTGLSPLETLEVARSPYGKVVKSRGAFSSVFGLINMRKPGSPWRDVRLRRALNYAINREDVIRYAAKGNGIVIPALVPPNEFGYPSELSPYPFDPERARRLLTEAGYADGITVHMLVAEDRVIQGTVIGKMLEQVGVDVRQETLDTNGLQKRIMIPFLDGPPEKQTWDIALTHWNDNLNFPPLILHKTFVVAGDRDWVLEKSRVRRLYEQILSSVDREIQESLIQEMEAHLHHEAYLLFLYSPIELYAVNKAVDFVPHLTNALILAETGVFDHHWSVRQTVSISRGDTKRKPMEGERSCCL